jgi:hypothetical protein
MSAKVVWMHVQRNKSVVVVVCCLLLVVTCKKKCTYYDLENLDSTAQNQLDPVDIIHNVGTAGWELHTLYKII